jgi:hypothetical protein
MASMIFDHARRSWVSLRARRRQRIAPSKSPVPIRNAASFKFNRADGDMVDSLVIGPAILPESRGNVNSNLHLSGAFFRAFICMLVSKGRRVLPTISPSTSGATCPIAWVALLLAIYLARASLLLLLLTSVKKKKSIKIKKVGPT